VTQRTKEASVIIVAGYIDVDPAGRDQFLADRQASCEASRVEPGCLEYVFSADSSNPARIRLFERWESKEALGTHLAGLAQNPPQAQENVPRVQMELLQYEVASVGPLGS
jgi:quinol monooxygenase YgiN